MKFDQLIMFVTVAELGSLSQASTRLHKTQPAISQGIRQLESAFNLALFNRAGYRLELTEAGKALYQKAALLLKEASALQQVATHLSQGNEASITIAIEASFNLKGILPLLANVQNQFPHTQIIIKQEYISGAFEAIQHNLATLCISPTFNDLQIDPQIDGHFLTNGSLINVAAPALINRHPKLNSSQMLLNEYQIIVQDSGKGSKDTEWGVQGGQRRWYVNDFSTKKMLIENAMGWGKLPDHVAEQSIKNGTIARLALLDVPNEIPLKYYIMKNKLQPLGPVAQAVWAQFTHYTFNQI
ncbi:LysR family transcriptional regulator [Paraglaciecola polaris]|uniref:LysR family transcriptional regulator n=1 Tax=Paraglaciecola polaris LMG 21857 TaxID=1129793 RepID=K7AHK7_9ALTE|nr:LysR family transcriptional regulator [Paraglaciecola polaris]GAC34725.1 LysR family transcriptional regulator [Paraglaciecola polaris LMG 21857]